MLEERASPLQGAYVSSAPLPAVVRARTVRHDCADPKIPRRLCGDALVRGADSTGSALQHDCAARRDIQMVIAMQVRRVIYSSPVR